ncbi:MAG: S1C family serine protease [Acidimicrobiales bacterium]
MDQQDDWAWRAARVRSRYQSLSQLGRSALLTALALALVGMGAGLALAAKDSDRSSASARAGLYAASQPRDGISASATRRLAKQLDPAVVDINAVIETPSGPANVAGTGMIVRSDGVIVTNNHVVENAKTIYVTVPGIRPHFLATFVGADPVADVAVIRVSGRHRFATVRFGNSSRVVLGERVLAFGNSLGLGGVASVTMGTVSALSRSITATSETGSYSEHLVGMIETDAPIAPGNSGGPLVNYRAWVIGMNTAAAPARTASGSPIAFALPINRVATICHWIETSQRRPGIVLGLSAYLGIEGSTIRFGRHGHESAVDIVQVEPFTPAARAGLQPGDVITAFAGHRVTSMSRLSYLITGLRPGALVSLSFQAGGIRQEVHLHLAVGPAA